jgi:hypothetical protein
MEGTGIRTTRSADRLMEWKSKLAIWSAAGLAFLTLSGLFIWLLPFSEFVQVNVLLHTIIGLISFAPLSWYCVRHWLVYRRHSLTYLKLLGYIAIFVLIVCAVSGLVLTYQPLFGIRISYFWQATHKWTTVALLAFMVPHVVLIVVRDAKARTTEAIAPVWVAARRYGWGTLTLTSTLFAVVTLFYFAYERPRGI